MIVIVFSKDRPLQLDATLRSFMLHCLDFNRVSDRIIVKASNEIYGEAYTILSKEYSSYSNISLIAEADFRQQVLDLLRLDEYVLWLVDDNIFVRDFYLSNCQQLLESNQDTLGYSLRLGENTTYCYPLDKQQAIPDFKQISENTYKYKWTTAAYDFGYPLEVSSSLYRTRDLLPLLESINFYNPNSLETELATRVSYFREGFPWLLCPIKSITFCNPINKVQSTAGENRAGESTELSSDSFLERFLRGERIDVFPFDGFTPNACHQEVELMFSVAKAAPPKVSVIISCFNQAHFLAEAVESVAAQIFTDWECLIVNDGSPDDTSEVARRLISMFPEKNLRLLEKKNGGLPDARNAGISASYGRYWLPLDADDRIEPTFLEKAVKILDERSEVGFVYSHISHFGIQNDVYILPEFNADTIVYTDNIACVCSLVRRIVWDQVGGYNINMREGYEDWDFWVGCIEMGWKGYRIPEPLFLYRKRDGSMLEGSNRKRVLLIARIVCNHPALYSNQRLQNAKKILSDNRAEPGNPRILIACSHFWPSIGGLETIVEQLSSNLVLASYDVSVVTSAVPGRTADTYRGANIISRDTSKLINGIPEWLLCIRSEVESGRYTACILIQDPQGPIIWSMEDIVVPKQTHLFIQPIINADGYSHWKDNASFRDRLKKILLNATAAITMSRSGPDDAYMRSEGIKPVYIPNAVSIPEPSIDFRSRFGIPDSTFLILHVANLYWVKNHVGLLNTLGNLTSNWKLVMIGQPSGERECAQHFHETLKTFPEVLYIPGLPPEDVSAAMEAADVIVLASHGEGSPVTILEAMAHGKPWLATPNCGAANDNAGGIICTLEDFPDYLHILSGNITYRNSLGELGSLHWNKCFTWPIVIEGWIDLIERRKLQRSFEMPEDIADKMVSIRNTIKLLVRSEKTPQPIHNNVYVNIGMITYNRLDFTRQSIEAMVLHTNFPYVLTVVDNASTDGSREYLLEQKRKGVIKNLVLLDENIGVAKASNLAWALEPDVDYYMKFDNDIVIQKPDWLAAMVHIVDGIPGMGAVAYNFEPESYAAQLMYGHTVRVKNGSIGGACFLVPKRTRDRVGYWCEDYGLYSEEDLDYCFRMSFAKMLYAYMEDEDIGIHLPAGKAAKIDLHSYDSHDGIEENEHQKYRQMKDDSRRKVVQSGLREKNYNDYRDGKRGLYVHSEYCHSWNAAGRPGLVTTTCHQYSTQPIQKLRITVFSLDAKEHACGYYRIQSPLKEIAGQVELSWGIEVREKPFRIIPGVAETADIIIVQRSFPRLETAEFLYHLCSLGKPIIFEIDDLLTQLPSTNLNYSWGVDCTPHIFEFIRKCSAVTVSTEELKKHFSSYNDAIHILPNLLDSDLWCKTSPPSSGPVVIGYAGTITHNTDLALLEEVLDRIASSYGNRVAFTFIGCATERISRLPGFSFIQFKNSFETYARELQEIPIDIMLVPLEDNPFNRCKSNIKWLEYSSCGIAGIYADLPPYNNCIEHGTTGLLAGSDPQQWFNAIDLLIRNSKLRRSIAMNARQKVMAEHTLKVGAQRWLQVYREIISMHAAQNATTAEDLSVPSKIDLDISNITTEKTLPQIGILCSDPLTCSCPAIRLVSPLKDLQESKFIKYVDITPLFQGTTDVLLQQLKNIDILVVQRDVSWKIPYSNLKQLLDRLHIKLVFEFDDAMTLLPTTNPHYDHYLNRRHFFEEYVRHADLLTVSTEQLRSLYSSLNPRIAVIPNCLDMTIWQGCPIKHPRTSSPLKILFSGTPTHVSDFMVLLGAIQRILAEFPERVELYLWGSQIAALQGHPQVHYVEKFFPNYYDYARILKSLNADIGVIPLEDNIFNRAKSCIKWLEYSACGIASICSDSDAYNTIVRHGKTGLLVKNEEAIWYKAIKELVLDDNLRFAIARNARLDVEQNHTISKNAHKWIDAYSLLLERTVDQSDRVNTVERSCGNSPALLLSIIIPLYNGVVFTRRCLDSLSAHADPTLYELILVDNASSDATSHLLNSLPPSVTVIRNATNLGFAHACNQGAWAATTPYILFLNNDTVVTPGWLATMIEACGPDVGIIGCRMLYPDGTIQHAGIELINGIPDHPYRHQPADMPAANTARDLDMVTGACLLIRRELFLQLAGFDEVYRNGVEDVDLCLRAREAGYRVVYQPKAMIYHHEGQSSGRFDHVDRNLRFFIDRWQGKFDKKDRFIASNPPVLMTAEKSYINEQRLHVVWQGSQFVYHSLALINREMCRRLIQIGHELSIVPYEQDEFFPEAGSPLAAIQKCVNRPLSQPADVVVRHQWPPDFNPPPAGHWVMIQPWEFGSIPLSWIGPMNEKLDEIWVPSSYVRECYIQSGVSRDKVFVVPNGVDTALYSPVGATYPIASGKSFRFLFVGGTIHRKGIDLLLAAYRQSFTAQDDVCLVIKDMGGKSFYQGQTAQEMIQRFSADPAAPEIVYIDSSLASDEMTALYRSCHCLVHPYRGEGFGLPIAEAMASGLPVIVTGYGAALDFCPPEIAWLVPAKEVRFATCCVGDIDTVGPPWLAEPDLDVLSDRMQHAFNHPDEARRRGQTACEHIRGNFTWDHAAHCVEARLQALRAKQVVRFTKEKITPRVADKTDRPADDEAKRRDVAARVMEQARVLQVRGETDAAVSMLIRQGIGVALDWPAPYLALAELLMGEKRFADAMQVVKEMPPATEETVMREIEAICQAALGDDEAARKSANQAPERPRALVVLGTLAARRGDLTGAEAFFRRAIGVDSSCGSAWLSLGILVWGQGKQEDAWQAVKRSVLVDPLNGEAARIMRDMAERRDQAEKQV